MINEENLAAYISLRIKELRKSRGFTVNSLANKSGLSQSYVRDLELGNKANISVVKLNELCLELGISLKDFFDENFIPEPVNPLIEAIHSLTIPEQNAVLNLIITLKNQKE